MCEEDTVEPGSSAFFMYGCLAMFLVCFAGLMSGLTLGLLSMDQLELQVLMAAGTEKEGRYAKKILPLIEKQHLLLVTLLLCNAMAMEALPIVLDRMMSSYIAILVSVTAVLIFGEVLPQGACSRYGLVIGAYASPLVKVLIFLTYPVSWPVSKLLDLILGKAHKGFFRKAEIKELVRLHGAEHTLTGDEALIMKGALEMREKTALAVMTPIESVYMLPIERKFDKACLEEIIEKRHSRIPVYKDGKKDQLVGLLIVKTLLSHTPMAFHDPEDQITVGDLPRRPILEVPAHTPLDELLNQFQQGRSHLAFVYQASELVGIVTLEDVIEELICEEIVDETDVYIDVHKKIRVVRSLVERASHTPVRKCSDAVTPINPTVTGAAVTYKKPSSGATPPLSKVPSALSISTPPPASSATVNSSSSGSSPGVQMIPLRPVRQAGTSSATSADSPPASSPSFPGLNYQNDGATRTPTSLLPPPPSSRSTTTPRSGTPPVHSAAMTSSPANRSGWSRLKDNDDADLDDDHGSAV